MKDKIDIYEEELRLDRLKEYDRILSDRLKRTNQLKDASLYIQNFHQIKACEERIYAYFDAVDEYFDNE